MAENSPELKNL